MERILLNQGLSFIACKIFCLVDTQSLLNCRRVCHLWNNFLCLHRFYWKRFYWRVQNHRDFKRLIKLHPKWKDLFHHFELCQCIDESKLFLRMVQRYLGRNFIQENQTPFHLAVISGALEEVQLVLHYFQLNDQDEEFSGFGFLTAAENGKQEMVELLLNEAQERQVSLIQSSYGQTAFSLACSNGHDGIAKLLLTEAKNNNCQLNIENGFISAYQNSQHHRVARLLFQAANFRTRLTLIQFVSERFVVAFKAFITEKKMSVMISFFFVVFCIFIASVHLRKL